MKTLEFDARLGPRGNLTVPPEIADQIDRAKAIRVILVQIDAEDDAWATLSAEQFLSGYAESDAVYDDLPAR